MSFIVHKSELHKFAFYRIATISSINWRFLRSLLVPTTYPVSPGGTYMFITPLCKNGWDQTGTG